VTVLDDLNGMVSRASVDELPAVLGALAEAEARVRLRLAESRVPLAIAPVSGGEDLSIEDAAKRFGAKVTTVYGLIRYGKIKAFKVGRYWRIPAAEIDRYRERQMRGGRG
jgi:excisionase family DNA binding protein